ncbi:MAG: hypothetical protein RR743_05440, partial [Oscillospiraceae bacterium]
MEINRSAIKQNAKTIIGTSKPNAILVALVYTAILFILNSLLTLADLRGATVSSLQAMDLLPLL